MKYLVLILTVAIAFCSCNTNNYSLNNKLKCPSYDPTILNTWFPYEVGKTYYYKDSTGDKHWLTIDNVTYNDGDEASGCDIPTECFPAGIISASRDIQQHDKIWLIASHSARKDGEHITLQWNSSNVELKVNNDGSLVPNPLFYDRPEAHYQQRKPVVTHHAKTWLNEVSYTDVYEILLPINDAGTTRRLYLAKEHGIVGYETQSRRTYWKE